LHESNTGTIDFNEFLEMITSNMSEREREKAFVTGEGELPRAAEKAAAAQKEEEGKAAAEVDAKATAERAVAGKAHVEVGKKEEEHLLHKERLLQVEKKSKEFAEKEAALPSRAEELHNKFAKQVLNI
jgi:hypothetical protein